MINNHSDINVEINYSMAEFFVMNKYKKLGIGTYAVKYVLNKYKVKWEIGYTPRNKIAKIFLNKIVKEYTKEEYEIIKNGVKKYKDGTIGEVLIFET
jgi:predicted acetyltransferase